MAVTFKDTQGASHSLAELAGNIVVVNFWATWCVPCREEMPAFARLQERWADRGVRFVGLAQDDPEKVARFGREVGVNYPLWVGDAAPELSRRLGNRLGVLPHTVILDRAATPIDGRVGPYTEADLAAKIRKLAGNS
jgi:thiol-disulfide isomerase/thioredoxin